MTGLVELIACYELTQAKAAYCRALDTKDWNGLAALMTADVEFGTSDGHSEPEMTVGRDETMTLLTSLVARRGLSTRSTPRKSTSSTITRT